jgi:hypothetical protein
MQVVEVYLGKVSGSKPRIIFNADYNPTTGVLSSYSYVEIDVSGGTISYGTSGGGDSATFTVSFTDGDPFVVYVSKKDGSNISSVSGGFYGDCQNGGWVCAVPDTDGLYAGIMNAGDATASAKFYGGSAGFFELQNHTDYPSKPCGQCDCLCTESCVPRKLYGTLTKVSGDTCCDARDDYDFEFDYDTEDEANCTWEGQIGETYCGGFDHQFHLEPSSSAGRHPACTEWYLTDPGGTPGFDGAAEKSPTSCTCDPFYLKYRFTVDDGSESCTFDLEVTDTAPP